jgi:hypothetical protein
MTFRAYVEDLLRDSIVYPCDCSAPEPCPSGHIWECGGQGIDMSTAKFMAEHVAKKFTDAPPDVGAFVAQVAQELFS